MENQHFLDDTELNITNERPSFLTVLCIITFIVSGFMLLYAIFGTLTYNEAAVRDALEVQLVEIEESPELAGNPMAKSIADGLITTTQEEIANHSILTVIRFFTILLSLLGAFMMYNLKKIGFHVYTASKIIGVAPLLIYTPTMVVTMLYSFIGVLSLVFIILYWVNS